MALDFQKVPISFSGGVDTKSDPKQIAQGKLLTLENATFKAPGSFRKPTPYAVASPVYGDTIRGIASLNGEALIANGATLDTIEADSRGVYIPCAVSQKSIAMNGIGSILYADSAVDPTTNHEFIAYTTLHVGSSTQLDVWYRVVDATTKDVVVADKLLAAKAQQPKVVAGNGRIAIFCIDITTMATPSLGGYLITAATPGTIDYFTVIDNTINPDTMGYDAGYIATEFLTANVTASSHILVQSFNTTTLTQTHTVSITTTCTGSVAIVPGTASLALFWTTAAALVFAELSTACVVTQSATTVYSGLYLDVCGAAWVSTTKIDYGVVQRWHAFLDTSKQYDNKIIIGSVVKTGGVWADDTTYFARGSVGLVAKPFVVGGVTYYPVCHSGYDQGTCSYFLISRGGYTIAKALQGSAGIVQDSWAVAFPVLSGLYLKQGGYPSTTIYTSATLKTTYSPTLPSSRMLSSLKACFPVNVYSLTDSRQSGVELTIDFSAPVYSLESGGTLLLSGGCPWMYDGSTSCEHGFNLYPAFLPTTVTDVGSTCNYGYVAWYEWTDAQGRLHMSAPTPAAVSVAKANPVGASYPVTVYVPTLRLTAKSGVRIGLARTINNGTQFHNLSSIIPQSLRQNQAVGADTWVYSDTNDDASIASLGLVYTAGGVLENIEPTSIGQIIEHRGRVVALSTENPFQAWYSKVVQPGLPVEFSDLLIHTPEAGEDPLTGVASMDDKLVFFKSNRKFYISGEGPDNTGANSDYPSPAYRIAGDLGCKDPRSIAVFTGGVARQTDKGMYLLDRGLGDAYFGAEAESLIGSHTVIGAVSKDESQTLRFVLDSSGGMLSYDYLVGQWGSLPDFAASYMDDDHYSTDHLVLVETAYCAYLEYLISTGWIQLGGLQGYQRARTLFILGEWKSPHKVTVQIAYDFDDEVVQTAVIDSSTAPASGPYQLRIDLTTQLCEAIKISISDVQSTSVSTGTISIGSPVAGDKVTISGHAFVYGTDWTDATTLAAAITAAAISGITAAKQFGSVYVTVAGGVSATWSADASLTLSPAGTIAGSAGTNEGLWLSGMLLEIGVRRGGRKMPATTQTT
jgi:hypothetical protein